MIKIANEEIYKMAYKGNKEGHAIFSRFITLFNVT